VRFTLGYTPHERINHLRDPSVLKAEALLVFLLVSVFDAFVITDCETLSLRVDVLVIIAEKFKHKVTPTTEVRIAKDRKLAKDSVMIAKYPAVDAADPSIASLCRDIQQRELVFVTRKLASPVFPRPIRINQPTPKNGSVPLT